MRVARDLGRFLLGIGGLADPDAELAPLPPRHSGRGVQEITGQQDGVMRTALELHGDLLVSYGEARRGIEKAPEELFGVGCFKSFELSCYTSRRHNL
jgi:hypothetical protein